MDIQKINKWIGAIIYEDGDKMHPGSLKTLQMIKNEIASVPAETLVMPKIAVLKFRDELVSIKNIGEDMQRHCDEIGWKLIEDYGKTISDTMTRILEIS
jgi:hypothetical protein